jgi:DNA-binding response OmpR family regulator
MLPSEQVVVETDAPPGRLRRRILLVDDEKQIRSLVSDALLGLGYDVVTAEDEDSALRAVVHHGDTLAMVLLDHAMPGLRGKVGLERIREISPHLPIIVTAGNAAAAGTLAGFERAAFLEKPYDVNHLDEAIGLLLTRANAA